MKAASAEAGPAAAAADVAIALTVVAGLMLVPWYRALAPAQRAEAPWDQWYLLMTAASLVELVVVLLLLRYRHQPIATVGLVPMPARRLLIATLAAVPLCYVAGAVASVLMIVVSGMDFPGYLGERRRLLYAFGGMPVRLVLPVSLTAGVTEEVVFRGFFLARLRALAGGRVIPVLLTSLLFGAGHHDQGFAGVAATAAMGLVLALVVLRAGSLWPAIAAHAIIDTLSLAAGVLLREQFEAA